MTETGVKFDDGKLRFDLVPVKAEKLLVEVLTYGAAKYAPDGWRTVPSAKARYTAALLRHFNAWRGGESVDMESGLSHLAHVLCNAAFLAELDE